MGSMRFRCPASLHEVKTGIEARRDTLLRMHEKDLSIWVYCPHCQTGHQIKPADAIMEDGTRIASLPLASSPAVVPPAVEPATPLAPALEPVAELSPSLAPTAEASPPVSDTSPPLTPAADPVADVFQPFTPSPEPFKPVPEPLVAAKPAAPVAPPFTPAPSLAPAQPVTPATPFTPAPPVVPSSSAPAAVRPARMTSATISADEIFKPGSIFKSRPAIEPAKAPEPAAPKH
jgi:hypothetical protein